MIKGIDITPIVKLVWALVSLVITGFFIPWIKSKTTQTQRNILRAFIKTLIFAAEQLWGAGHGPEKFAYVKEQLLNAGYILNEAELKAEIEAAVGQYLNYTNDVLIESVVDADLDITEEE